ncbi:hypothetical protein [Brevibacillus brevis]|uniref:hypothetical protein n=1 Tax=Brevibacillus brevis TaxID=1393 RepID=UPI000D0E5934|nr:hypothetical protein [Brevibacillus brevis]PSJ66603.1 hypothetical protein C7J99_24955 [Brevibacillus brevis]RED20929.1 hypothetical protein DES34_12711 [Brevibacillus brevis]GEC93871.1 hypothetical protein BBR01nite_62020 [Brevibacillus brevis]VEF92055.1 Uncharacterised protein [Brevibacillus brevis]
MIDAYMSLDQVTEIARNLSLGEAKTFLLSEAGKIGIVVKETNEKVSRIKQSGQTGVTPFYLEEHDTLTISIQPVDGTEKDAIVGYIRLNAVQRTELLSALKETTKRGIGIEFYSVSESLELVSVRNVIIEEMSRFALKQQLDRIKE